MADDDDFDLDGALEQSLAQMEANETTPNTNNNNNTVINMNENESKEDRNNNSSNAADDAIMQEALNAVQQSMASANDAQSNNDMMNDDEMKDFFNEIFKSFSNLDDDADDESLDKALKKVMTQFFDSNQLKEPVAIICNKYPLWLEENKETLSKQDYDNYKSQYELYREANTLLTSSKPDTSRIMDILLKTFSYGSLPPAVMDGMMPDELKQFADQMAAFEKDIDKNPSTQDNDKNNRDDSTQSNDNKKNGDDDMNAEEAMKFFQQLMGMQNNGNSDEQKDNDFMPNLSDLPKLNEQEMQQFKQLMNQDGCSIM